MFERNMAGDQVNIGQMILPQYQVRGGKVLLFTLMLIFGFLSINAQGPGESYARRLRPAIVQTGSYLDVLPPAEVRQSVSFPMGFADHRIQNPGAMARLSGQVMAVDLVFTLYPKRPDDWEIGYDNLMERRYRELESRRPDLFRAENVIWRVILQTNCRSLAQARGMFHGFVLHSGPLPVLDTVPPPTVRPAFRFDSIRMQSSFEMVTQMLTEDSVSHHDSTAIEVFEEEEWGNALVVADWTASMLRHGALLLRWHFDHLEDERISHTVFFNDGDGKYDDEKEVGATGGIYDCSANALPALLTTIEAVTMGGEGGDHRENDLEALLHGLAMCPECDEVILIADNNGPVRDLQLLPEIDRPVRVILYGSYGDDIHPDYLTIADYTAGSLHTSAHHLEEISIQLVHGILTVGEEQYLRVNGRFQRHKPRN